VRRLGSALAAAAIVAAAIVAAGAPSRADDKQDRKEGAVELGNFSVSLKVADVAASRAFYEKLGFSRVMGDGKGWLILRNGACTLGLFSKGLERNTLTFNPGWTSEGKPLERFQDVREIQRVLKERGIVPKLEADEASKGPASVIVVDPDGNPILLDQHVPRPSK
jgi:catechol 2,3-dioxygenase-like lactoylglutathione lyase family enzyme